MPRDVSVTEARALQGAGHTYIDVRSAREFATGHPAGAINVPLIDADPDTGQMAPNPDFVRVIKAVFAADAALLIGCQVGGRSARAAQVLEAMGFTNVANVAGGFGGLRDPMSGRIVAPGWMDESLPVETASPPGMSYDDLVARADAQ